MAGNHRGGSARWEGASQAAGAPRLLPGQHKAWVMGRTAIGTELEQEALVQSTPLQVSRDTGRVQVSRDTGQDFHREVDTMQRGRFIID